MSDCQYCGKRLPHAPYEDGIIECRNRLFDEVADLRMQLDVHKAGVAVDSATRDILNLTVRQACRKALAIDGADAQALEGALQQTERELVECAAYYSQGTPDANDGGAFARQCLQRAAIRGAIVSIPIVGFTSDKQVVRNADGVATHVDGHPIQRDGTVVFYEAAKKVKP